MNTETALRWSYAHVLTKKRYDALVARFGSLEKTPLDEDTLRAIGCREDTVMKTLVRMEEFDPDAYAKALSQRGLTLRSIEEADYPVALKTLPDPPMFLTTRGDLSIVNKPCIALVGTRKMSAYGKRVTEVFLAPIMNAGIITVSGLARGIDAEVARETLRGGGLHVAVLGHGLGMIFPKTHTSLADEIVEAGGLLISEFPLDYMPDTYTFPARNRIIAGLSLATVVLEAAEDSGSLITANLALEYARDVFAVPGQIFDEHYVGCHRLLKRGEAGIAVSGNDVLSALGIVTSDQPIQQREFTDPIESTIYQSLTSMPQSLDDLSVKASLDAATIAATLTILELQGAVRNVGQGNWIRA